MWTFPSHYFDLDLDYAERHGWRKLEQPRAEGMWQASEANPPVMSVAEWGKPLERYGPPRWWERDLPDPHAWGDGEQGLRVLSEASRLQIKPEQVEADPALRGLVSQILDIEEVLALQEQGRALPPAPGLTPSAQERIRRASHLTRGSLMVLRDGFAGRRAHAQELADELNDGLVGYGLKVGLKPPRQHSR